MRPLDDKDRFDFIETKFDKSEEQELFTRLTFKVDKGQDFMRIDKWVQMRIEGASRNKVQQAIDGCYLTGKWESGKIQLQGKTIRRSSNDCAERSGSYYHYSRKYPTGYCV
jgi:hypothetical protein